MTFPPELWDYSAPPEEERDGEADDRIECVYYYFPEEGIACAEARRTAFEFLCAHICAQSVRFSADARPDFSGEILDFCRSGRAVCAEVAFRYGAEDLRELIAFMEVCDNLLSGLLTVITYSSPVIDYNSTVASYRR